MYSPCDWYPAQKKKKLLTLKNFNFLLFFLQCERKAVPFSHFLGLDNRNSLVAFTTLTRGQSICNKHAPGSLFFLYVTNVWQNDQSFSFKRGNSRGVQNGSIFHTFLKCMCKMCVEWSNLSRDGRKVFSKIYHPTLLMLNTQKLESFEKIGCHFPHWHWGGERYPDSSVEFSTFFFLHFELFPKLNN